MLREPGLGRIGRPAGAGVEESPHEPFQHRMENVSVLHVIEPAVLLGLERVDRLDLEPVSEEEPSRTGSECLEAVSRCLTTGRVRGVELRTGCGDESVPLREPRRAALLLGLDAPRECRAVAHDRLADRGHRWVLAKRGQPPLRLVER